MAIAEELQIIVDAKVSQAVRDMKKVDKTIDNTSKTTNKLKDAFKAMAGPVAIGAVITGMIKLGKEAEKAFQTQEKAELGLNAALRATGQFTREAFEEMKDFSSGLQEITTVGDETSIRLLQTAVNMGLTADEAKNATKQAIGMSEAYGVGLETALRASANATLGNFDALTRYLPAIKNATTEAEKAAIVNKQLGDAFAVAESNAKSAAGVQQQLKNSYGDLQETIGGVIANALTPYRENLKQEVEAVNRSVTAHLLRKKALAGNATSIETLTLRQLEQQKAEEDLAQAKLNVANAEDHVLDTTNLSLIQIQQITLARNAGVEKAKENIKVLQQEVEFRSRATGAAKQQVLEEQKLTQANVELAQGILSVTEASGKNTEEADRNEQEWLDNYNAKSQAEFDYREAILDRTERQIEAEAEATRATIAANEERKESYRSLYTNITGLSTNFFTALDSLSSATGAAELQRLEESGASEERLDKKKKELARQGAIRKKALGLLSVGVDTAAAIIGFLSDPGGIPGIVLSALAGTTGGIQAAAIAATPIPAFAQGGSFLTQGQQDIRVGDNAGGVERVTVEPISSRGANVNQGAGSGTMILNIDGRQFTGWLQSQLDNGQLRLPRRAIV